MKTSTVLGTAIGFIAGVYLSRQLSSRSVSPEYALKEVKRKFPGKVDGSWIYTTKETITRDTLHYNVFKGGLTCSDRHYDFTVDADSGVILELNSSN